MGKIFTPTETFEADVNGHTNRYKRGQQYIVYDTPDHKELGKAVQRWAEEGRIQITGATPGAVKPAGIKTGGK